MEHFVMIERAIACPRASAAVAAETAAQVLTEAGYRRGLGFGPTSSYVRAYRPVWAVVLAAVGAVPTLGLSFLLLKVRSKDHCNVVIEDGPYGVVALVSGRVPTALSAVLEAASGQYVDPQQHGGSYGQQAPPPMLLTPSAGAAGAPERTPQAILRPATSVPGVGGQPGDGYPQHPAPSFDPYPVPQHSPSGAPDRARRLDQLPDGHPDQAVAAPVPMRPPSRLAPPMPSDVGREQSAAAHAGAAGVNGAASAAAPAGAAPVAGSDDDPFSSTSGRVPWVGGGRPGPLPAPPGPAQVSPLSRPPVLGGSPPPGVQPGPGGQVTKAPGGGLPVLRVDTGEVLEFAPFCLLGREPVSRDGDPEARLVHFDDPKLSVSKTHMAYGVDEQGVWIMDRNSTNGTTVIDPTGRRIPCGPGSRQYVIPGYQVQIGQRRISVEAADNVSA